MHGLSRRPRLADNPGAKAAEGHQVMRIAVIGMRGAGRSPDGIEAALRQVCPRLARRGHEIDVFSERNGRSIGAIEGAQVIRLPTVPGAMGEAASHAMLSSLVTACRGYDVVNFCAGETGGLFSIVAKLGLHRTVVSVHGLDRPAGSVPFFAPESVAARFADEITVVSRRLERHFRDAYGRETVYIPNGIDPTPAVDPGPLAALGVTPRQYLLFADRLTARSGCHLLMRAAHALPPRLKVVVAETGDGDEDYQAGLRQEADPSNVLFAGQVGPERLDALMAHAHLFVLPSLAEDPPATLLQALAAGRAVVVSDETDHTDLVGADGFTFTSGDERDLRRVLTWLADDEEVVARMEVRAAATAATHFCWDRIAEAYEQVFASVL
jgi:glycosyltransferase involved in cell wall biosynthesis